MSWCTERARRLLVSLETTSPDAERKLSVAHFPLPLACRRALGRRLPSGWCERSAAAWRRAARAARGDHARRARPHAAAGLLLPQTCYLAAAAIVHGAAQTLSLGARAGASNTEATSEADQPGPHVGFVPGRPAQSELDVRRAA